MAEAKRAIKKTTGEDKGVLLHLTNTEAEVLVRLFGRVGGHPVNSPRKYVERIDRALRAVGVEKDDDHYRLGDFDQMVMFADYPPKPKKAKKVVQQSAQPAPVVGPQVGDTIEFTRRYAGEYAAGTRMVVDKRYGVTLEGQVGEYRVYVNVTDPNTYRVVPKAQQDVGQETVKGIEKGTEVSPRKPQVGDRAVLLKPGPDLLAGKHVEITGIYGEDCTWVSLQGRGVRWGWAKAEDLRLVA